MNITCVATPEILAAAFSISRTLRIQLTSREKAKPPRHNFRGTCGTSFSRASELLFRFGVFVHKPWDFVSVAVSLLVLFNGAEVRAFCVANFGRGGRSIRNARGA
jgi:hypothetical protein